MVFWPLVCEIAACLASELAISGLAGMDLVLDACDCSLFSVWIDNFPSALHGSDCAVLEG